MKKALLIVNPVSGKQAAKQCFFDIVNNLSLKYEVTVHITKSAEDLYEAAKSCTHTTMIVCGGDGTLSGAVRGLWENPLRDKIRMGYIPSGTANDVASTLEIPKTMPAAALYVCRNSAKSHDLGFFGDRPFIYTASFGTFTKATYETPQDVKNALGVFAYFLGGASEIFDLKGYDVTFEYEGNTVTRKDITFCSVSNTHYLGGGLIRYTSDIVGLDDGKLEILTVARPKNLFELENILRSLLQKQFNNEYVSLIQTPSVRIKCDTPLAFTVDGDSGGEHTDITVSCLKDGLKFIRK